MMIHDKVRFWFEDLNPNSEYNTEEMLAFKQAVINRDKIKQDLQEQGKAYTDKLYGVENKKINRKKELDEQVKYVENKYNQIMSFKKTKKAIDELKAQIIIDGLNNLS